MPRWFRDAVAVFAFEWRAARRSLLVWLAAVATVGVGVGVYTRFSALHVAGYAPPPRFALPSLGLLALWVSLLGVVALIAGLRARDERARVAEALDSRPISNGALLFARLAAVVLPAWLSLVALGIVVQIGGIAAERYGWLWLGEPLEPVALATFLTLDAPPTLFCWAAVATLAAAWMRNRAAVIASLAAVLALAYFALLHTPIYLLPALAGITHLGLPGSEILPRYPSGVDIAQRLSSVALATGCLVAAASWLPRVDHVRRRRRRAGALGLAVAGATGIGLLCVQAAGANAERRAWAAARLALEGAPRPDVERLSGRVDVDPGKTLTLDLTLQVRLPDELAAQPLRFSLNPGLVPTAVTVAGEPAPHTFDLGLLTLAAPPAPAAGPLTIGIRAAGRPDADFGYPDSASTAWEESLMERRLVLWGERAVLFERDFVALPPGSHWLPRADVAYSAALATGDRDFRAIDLDVRLPEGWIAVAPGRDQAGVGVRFRPATPLAEFALLAAPWRRETAVIGGVACELLVHPKHAVLMQRLRPFTASMIERHASQLKSLAKNGLGYGIGAAPAAAAFSVVEAPAALRRYGGGQLMDSVQALPGVQLLAEHGVPTRRFDEATLEAEAKALDRIPAAADVPPLAGVWRNLLPFLTHATGGAGPRLNLLLDALTAQEVQPGGAPTVFGAATLVPWRRGPADSVLHRLFGAMNVQTAVPWSPGDGDAALAQEAAQLAAALAATRFSQNVTMTGVLSGLRARHAGAHLTRSDFVAALRQQVPAFAPIVDGWLDDGALPGYVTSAVQAYRLPDDSRGQPRYQVRLRVRNNEPAPGVVALVWRAKGWFFQPATAAVPVPANSAIALGAVLPQPATELHLDTFLSRNRGAVRLYVPPADPQAIVDEAPLAGARPSDWAPRTEEAIVVDDLDPAFTAESAVTSGLRFMRRVERASGPQVPAARVGGSAGWERQEHSVMFSWGRYRRSLVSIDPGTGDSKATFRAVLPAAGRWRLAYHLPGPHLLAGSVLENGPEAMRIPLSHLSRFGTLDLHVETAAQRFPVAFDAADAAPGWNALGTFDLPAGEVAVTVSDRTSGALVVADAVRWAPADNEQSPPTP